MPRGNVHTGGMRGGDKGFVLLCRVGPTESPGTDGWIVVLDFFL